MLCTVPSALKVDSDRLEVLEDTQATLKIKVPAASVSAYKTAAHAAKIVANE